MKEREASATLTKRLPSPIKRSRRVRVAVLNSIKKVQTPFCTLATLAGQLLRSFKHTSKIQEREHSDRTIKRCKSKVFPKEPLSFNQKLSS